MEASGTIWRSLRASRKGILSASALWQRRSSEPAATSTEKFRSPAASNQHCPDTGCRKLSVASKSQTITDFGIPHATLPATHYPPRLCFGFKTKKAWSQAFDCPMEPKRPKQTSSRTPKRGQKLSREIAGAAWSRTMTMIAQTLASNTLPSRAKNRVALCNPAQARQLRRALGFCHRAGSFSSSFSSLRFGRTLGKSFGECCAVAIGPQGLRGSHQ